MRLARKEALHKRCINEGLLALRAGRGGGDPYYHRAYLGRREPLLRGPSGPLSVQAECVIVMTKQVTSRQALNQQPGDQKVIGQKRLDAEVNGTA